MYNFQDIILNLQQFWTKKGCLLQQSHDLQTGAGTFNPETFLRALGNDPYNVCNVEISRRPTDGRYGENPNRLQRFHQFQVMMKPTPKDFQQYYLESLEAIGLNLKDHDIRFVHDDWESPTQGASGLGWEVWCDGMEITQYTYFQQIGGIALKEIPVELAYGIERIALFLQGKKSIYDLQYNDEFTYGEVFLEAEKQYSAYNFDEASIDMWTTRFDACEKESLRLIEQSLPVPAYDMAIEASHSFNMLDARGAISTTARVSMIHRVRNLCCSCARSYLEEKEKSRVLEEPILEEVKLTPVKSVSSKTVDFLLEVGVEHLPANAVNGALVSLTKLFTDFFKDKRIEFSDLEVYGSAKRLALTVNCSTYTTEQIEEKKGIALSKAFDVGGKITNPGKGFLSSLGVTINTKEELLALSEVEIQDGRIVFLKKQEKECTGKVLQDNLVSLILSLRFPKKMRWGKQGVQFCRPIKSLVTLFGKQIIDIEIEGVRSSNKIFLNDQMGTTTLSIFSPLDYLPKLKKSYVLASLSERKAFIEKQLLDLCLKETLHVACKEEVLKEVMQLSEYPLLAIGEFEEKFLSLPSELIMKQMVSHQKYFPLQEESGQISRKFVMAIDKKPTDTIIKNNQSVLTARLSDGLFLYKKDLKSSFSAFNEKLKSVILHPKLGSIYNKVERIVTLSQKLSKLLNLPIEKNAALYCKADLVSDVVYEFPELQGIMGKYYGEKFLENSETCLAIEQSYEPKVEGGVLPSTNSGIVVALSDKLDNLMSYMGIGLIPTSSKDPYALRRAAIGVNRILIEKKLSLDIREISKDEKVLTFIIDRTKGLLKEYGFSATDIEMCNLYESYNPFLIYECTDAIARFRSHDEDFARLAALHKRLKGTVKDHNYTFSKKDLQEKEEERLHASIDAVCSDFEEYFSQHNFDKALLSLTTLVKPLEEFFDSVRVNVEDEKLRSNRIALLQKPLSLISSTLKF